MDHSQKNFYTALDIAQLLTIPKHRIQYAIGAGNIPRPELVGTVHVWTIDQFLEIQAFFAGGENE